jgi:hypothetical protein
MEKRRQGGEARYDQNRQLAILKDATVKASCRDQNERIKVRERDAT